MIQLHFGTSDRRLFGVYGVPSPSAAPRGAALLCPPWGQEYVVSHRLYLRLANRLSQAGYHVLRFDYFGTGDSDGDRRDGDLESWQDDATTALEELRDISGAAAVTVLGIRLGAAVAWRLATARREVRAAVLWDPVISGTAYVQDLIQTQRQIDRFSLTEPLLTRGQPGDLHLLGFPMTLAMRASIERIQLETYAARSNAEVKLFFSDVVGDGHVLSAAMQAAGVAVRSETLLGASPWREDESTGHGALPEPLLERMIEGMP